MKNNVLFVLNSLNFGGAEKHVVTLLNNLDDDKFELSLATLHDMNGLESQLDKNKLTNWIKVNLQKKIDLRAAKKLACFIDDNEIDTLVTTNPYPMFYSFLAKFFIKRKVRFINVHHTTIVSTFSGEIKMMFYRLLYPSQELLVFVCQAQKYYCNKRWILNRNEKIIYNGVDEKKFNDVFTETEKNNFREKCGFNQADYIIGISAVFRPEKNHLDLLKALLLLKTKNIHVKAVLIGDGPERTKIESYIEDNNLSSDVFITGFLEDVRLAVSSSDVMVVASSSVETFSIAVLESMSLSKPIIMTDIGGAREQVKDGINGLIYKPNDIEALAKKIESLSREKLRKSFGEKSRETILSNFTEIEMIQKFSDTLTSIKR
jgi:glycosyltransferase involved in cell wall biosynthesis